MKNLKTAIILVLIGISICCIKKENNSGFIGNQNVIVSKRSSLDTVLSSSSGLCYTNNKLFTFNDSGNPADLYQIDSTTGAIKQIIHITNYPNIDWEDITADETYIYIGDFGNNNGNRKNLRVLKIRKSDINTNTFEINVLATAIGFEYADQKTFSTNKNNNYDCEAMINVDSCLYLFTKNRGDEKTRMYKLSKTQTNQNISPIIIYDCKGKITGADYDSTTKEVALIGYENKKQNSFLLFLTKYKKNNFFNGSIKRITIGKANKDWQTEGICYVSPQHLLFSCETSENNKAGLYSIEKN
jgi:hypothetical protein